MAKAGRGAAPRCPQFIRPAEANTQSFTFATRLTHCSTLQNALRNSVDGVSQVRTTTRTCTADMYVRAPRNIRPATRARFTSIGRGLRRTGDPAAPYERALPRVFWDETGTLLAPALRSDHVPFLAKRGNCTTLTATIGRLTPALGEYLQDLPSLEKHRWPRTVKHAVADVRTCACLILRCTLRCWVWIREAEVNPNTMLHVADTGALCRFRAQCRSAGRSRLPCRVRQRVCSPQSIVFFLIRRTSLSKFVRRTLYLAH